MIIRAKHDGKTAPYSIISRNLLQENQIPYGPKCLLLLMLSFPDTWNFNITCLADMMLQSEATIREWLNKLNELGYFHEDVNIEFNGTHMHVRWLVTEEQSGVKNEKEL